MVKRGHLRKRLMKKRQIKRQILPTNFLQEVWNRILKHVNLCALQVKRLVTLLAILDRAQKLGIRILFFMVFSFTTQPEHLEVSCSLFKARKHRCVYSQQRCLSKMKTLCEKINSQKITLGK